MSDEVSTLVGKSKARRTMADGRVAVPELPGWTRRDAHAGRGKEIAVDASSSLDVRSCRVKGVVADSAGR